MMKLVLIVLFSVIVLMDTVSGSPPIDGYPSDVIHPCDSPQFVGDNNCDDGNNNEGCGWDGGDCCGDSVNTQFCSACECLDPNGGDNGTNEPPTLMSQDCGCASIEVYHNGPLEYTHKSIYGYYVRQEDLINERPWFKNNGKSIWWDTKYWRLGWTNRTGGQRSHAKLYSDERCLTKISDQEWTLYDSNANWSNAGNKLRIRCGYKPKGYGTSCCSKIQLSLKGAALNEQGRLAGIYDKVKKSLPGSPSVSVTDVTSRSVTLAWNPPSDTGGVHLTGYIIKKSLPGSPSWER